MELISLAWVVLKRRFDTEGTETRTWHSFLFLSVFSVLSVLIAFLFDQRTFTSVLALNTISFRRGPRERHRADVPIFVDGTHSDEKVVFTEFEAAFSRLTHMA